MKKLLTCMESCERSETESIGKQARFKFENEADLYLVEMAFQVLGLEDYVYMNRNDDGTVSMICWEAVDDVEQKDDKIVINSGGELMDYMRQCSVEAVNRMFKDWEESKRQ